MDGERGSERKSERARERESEREREREKTKHRTNTSRERKIGWPSTRAFWNVLDEQACGSGRCASRAGRELVQHVKDQHQQRRYISPLLDNGARNHNNLTTSQHCGPGAHGL